MNNVSHYDPLSLMSDFQNEIGRLFGRDFGRLRRRGSTDTSTVESSDWIPAVDIKEEPNRFIIHVDVPGVEPEKIEISMADNTLTIRGERTIESKEGNEDFIRVERARGVFYRRFTLPDTANADQIAARYNKGVLEVEIPKHEQKQPRKIFVQISDKERTVETGKGQGGEKGREGEK